MQLGCGMKAPCDEDELELVTIQGSLPTPQNSSRGAKSNCPHWEAAPHCTAKMDVPGGTILASIKTLLFPPEEVPCWLVNKPYVNPTTNPTMLRINTAALTIKVRRETDKHTPFNGWAC